MAGITANMVLVSTYNNGAENLVLPSTDFNHCIAKVVLDNKEYYIELTDNYLPFASLPNNLVNAQILPITKVGEPTTLKHLVPNTKTKDIVRREIVIKPQGYDLKVNAKSTKFGHLSAQTRAIYSNLNYQSQLEEMQKSVANSYENNVEMDTVIFGETSKLNDSIFYAYSYKIKDEVIEIGNLKTLKITYPDVITSPTKFPNLTRVYPIDYNGYEDTDLYETTVVVEIPKGSKFTTFPQDESLTFKKMTYKLQ